MSQKNTAALRRQVRSIQSPEDIAALLKHAHPLTWYRPGRVIEVSDKMQSRYKYRLTARPGKLLEGLEIDDEKFRNAAEIFAKSLSASKQLSPGGMLRRGVFEGKYLNDCVLEFPREWYAEALERGKLSPGKADPSLNEFGVKSRKSLRYWVEKGWIPIEDGDQDVRGWFQWYARYWIGRRDPAVDRAQIMRWYAFRRHAGQITASYRKMRNEPKTRADKRGHRAKQRQALLQWAYDPYI